MDADLQDELRVPYTPACSTIYIPGRPVKIEKNSTFFRSLFFRISRTDRGNKLTPEVISNHIAISTSRWQHIKSIFGIPARDRQSLTHNQ